MTKRFGNSKRYLSFMLAVLMAITVFSLGLTPARAAGFSGEGKGTVNNPYLVTNAQQVDEMRNNLSAHYKLANNIDLSSVANFDPIGQVQKPFKGSFTCDTAADGTPKYIIKNLTIHLDPPGSTRDEKYSGYDENTAKWTAGFFGATEGAKLTNIVILNADVKNEVEGNASMNSDWSTNPGMAYFQSCGILIGSSLDTNVTGCGVSGKVVSSANGTGGLIGTYAASDGKTATLKNSYSFADVTAEGPVERTQSGVGGLFGSQETYWEKYNGTVRVEGCAYSGTFTGGKSHSGAFVGSVNEKSTIKNCWAAGVVMTSSSGCFFGIDNLNWGIAKNTEVCENCYTLAIINGRTKPQQNKKVTNNNWITNEKGGLETGFAAGSVEEIGAAFTGLDAWTVTAGEYPQLKNVHSITDASKYDPIVPGQSEPTEAPTTKPTEAPTTKPTEAPTTAPTQGTTAPTQGTTAPTQGTTAPTQGTTAPTQGTTAPTQGTTAPTQGTTAPTQGTTAPTQEPSSAPTEIPTEGTNPTQDVPPSDVPTEDTVPTEGTVPADDSGDQGGVTITVTEDMLEITLAEKILIGVLAAIVLGLTCACVIVIVRWSVLMKAIRGEKLPADDGYGDSEV